MDIDITRHLGMVDRQVAVRERDGRPAKVLVATRTYETSIDDLWDAVTNPERIPRWFLPVAGDFRVGGRFSLTGNASGDITRCDAPRHLALTWEMHGDTSWVTVELTEVEGEEEATQLRLEHVAFVPDEFWNQFGPGAVGIGWELGLMGLALHVSGAAAVDHAEAEQWPATPDGRRFVEHASDGWCAASIAAGTPTDAAKAAAVGVTAFYTGQPAPTPES